MGHEKKEDNQKKTHKIKKVHVTVHVSVCGLGCRRGVRARGRVDVWVCF